MEVVTLRGTEERGVNHLAGRSWRHLLAALALLVSISVAGGLAAQTDEYAGAPVGTEEASADAAEAWDAGERVRQMMAEWKATDPSGRRFRERSARGEISLVEGVGQAQLNIQDKRWGKSRSLAYTRAFAESVREFVSRIKKKQTSELLRDYFEENLDESEYVYRQNESTDEAMLRVVNKVATLGERKLDQALAESGMSADEIARMTPPQKKITFSDRLSLKATTLAFGSAAGLVPIKTFEAFDDEGNSAVGVVAVRSSRMRYLADQIAAGKTIRPDDDRAGAPITDRIGVFSDKELTNEFGPRVWWDEHGYPTIVAFGQWAWSPEGLDKRKRARRRDFAMKQALADANTHLSTFINASTRFTTVSNRGGGAEEFSLISADGTVSDEETAKIVDRLVESARMSSDVQLTGSRVQREWFSRHPELDDHELVGVIVSWSPAQEDQIRAELGKKPKHQPPAEKTVQKTRVSSGTAESLDLMDPADF